ncbi:hypothetical protein D9758_000182 [Tetrapyrgos nigripes]|uniref:Transcription factor domain-containing protein n=1 Tax=Tetrapyrgos nigripes TaxID=182062 RepID=A0A8H5LZG9_9AGAR|nr:hypothetical protein D9758_000182 [Tetrapyrgos nigripes]
MSHAPAGAEKPVLECTFDEPPENQPGNDAPKNKYEKLESRIAELEGLLRQKDHGSETSASPSIPALSSYDDLRPPNEAASAQSRISHNGSPEISIVSSAARAASGMGLGGDLGMDMVWSHWPPNLPGAELLKHLVDAFFVFQPHARRLFHYSTFMACLALPPSHPKFPSVPVLHGICAVGALFTAAVSSPPPLRFEDVSPEEIFAQRRRLREDRPDTFAEIQARFAKEAANELEYLGRDLVQVLQTNILLCWYYWPSTSPSYICSELHHNFSLISNLAGPSYSSILHILCVFSVVPAAKSVVEDETRRNAFWFAYAIERQYGFSNAWALSMDDQDISQLLPVREDQFERGILVPPKERQWAHTPGLLRNHTDGQVDPFILYMKACVLMSKVKTFNLRFRAKHFAGEDASSAPSPYIDEPIDPRRSQAFVDLDQIASNFLALLPPDFKDPIQNDVVDSTLFSAIAMIHVSNIVLHEPHADVRRAGCISALKMLTAARAVIDMVYAVWSTSFNISLFEPFMSFCFFLAGRVFARFYQAAVEQNSMEQMSTLSAEFNIVRTACEQMGNRHRIAACFAKMMDDLIVKAQGSSIINERPT